jgi:hypothetical protein
MIPLVVGDSDITFAIEHSMDTPKCDLEESQVLQTCEDLYSKTSKIDCRQENQQKVEKEQRQWNAFKLPRRKNENGI